MSRIRFLKKSKLFIPLALLPLLMTISTGCSTGGDNDKGAITGIPTAVNGITSIRQAIPPQNIYDRVVIPGHTNLCDINPDFTLCTGGFTQPHIDSMYLTIDNTPFPYDQDFNELTFFTPLFTTSDGIVTATIW
ncbi:MAG: hypothetical protein C0609_00525, partial [Deltaproteobacteria bacterium]